jgi:Subunit ChlI of Mg-chelatase
VSVAVVYSRAQVGIEAPLVTVEVHLSNGLPGLSIVGLPEAAVKESKDRVRSGLLNSQFEFRSDASPSTWRRPICPRKVGASIWPSRWVSWPRPASSMPPPAWAGKSRERRLMNRCLYRLL